MRIVLFNGSKRSTVLRRLMRLSIVCLIQDAPFFVRTTDSIPLQALYSQYFEQEQHPSSSATLLKAVQTAGIPETEAKAFIDDESEGLMDVKMSIQEQAGNGVDAVPYIIIEGKRRDVTLEGAKEVEEYVKALQQIIKESS